MPEPRSRPESRAVTETMVRRLSRAISVSPGWTSSMARSESRTQRPGATGTGAWTSRCAALGVGGAASTTRTGHALTPRTICPAGSPATAGVTASDNASAESPARAAPGPGTIETFEPLTTTPLFTSTTPRTSSRIPATSRA